MKKVNREFIDVFLECVNDVEREILEGKFKPSELDTDIEVIEEEDTMNENTDKELDSDDTPFLHWVGAYKGKDVGEEDAAELAQFTAQALSLKPTDGSDVERLAKAIARNLKEGYDANGNENLFSDLVADNDNPFSLSNLAIELVDCSDLESRYEWLLSKLDTIVDDTADIGIIKQRIKSVRMLLGSESLNQYTDSDFDLEPHLAKD